MNSSVGNTPVTSEDAATNCPVIHAVMVHYGDSAGLPCAIDRLVHGRGVRVFLILVDNNPCRSEEIERRVEALGGEYLHEPANPGFAGGGNTGLQRGARRGDGDLMVVLNSDVLLGRHALRRLWGAFVERPKLGVAGPTLLCAEDPWTCWNAGTDVLWPAGRPRSRRHLEARGGVRGAQKSVDFVCGAVLAMRSEVLSTVGLLPERYFLFYEDADFAQQVRQAGWEVAVLPNAVAWHYGGRAMVGVEAEVLYYRTRNRLLFSASWNPYAFRGRMARGFFLVRALWGAALKWARGRRSEAAALRQAVLDYWRGREGRRVTADARDDRPRIDPRCE